MMRERNLLPTCPVISYQSRKQLQKYKCPFICLFVCPSVTNIPKQHKINHSNFTNNHYTTSNMTHLTHYHIHLHTQHHAQYHSQHHTQHHYHHPLHHQLLILRLLSFSACQIRLLIKLGILLTAIMHHMVEVCIFPSDRRGVKCCL